MTVYSKNEKRIQAKTTNVDTHTHKKRNWERIALRKKNANPETLSVCLPLCDSYLFDRMVLMLLLYPL